MPLSELGSYAPEVPKRILPISSGKGGVGKTTVAVNFALALSRRASTVLVDLDTGTSSVRSTLGTPVTWDLYHFHRKQRPLRDCITVLDEKLDPQGRFRQFGFVAGPRHYLEELADPSAELRRRLAKEINSLPADYVVLDLRAGLDSHVLEFLPYTNSGILVFTPHLPQATLAASDIVKAIVFRTFRSIFQQGSPIFSLPGFKEGRELIRELLDRAEDVYDDSVPNVDFVLRDLRDVFGDHPLVSTLEWVLSDFRIFGVLNMFNGVEESHQAAVTPFLKNLSDNLSTRVSFTQLGWIVQDERVHRGNCTGRPILLEPETAPAHPSERGGRARKENEAMAELEQLRTTFLGLDRKRPPAASVRKAAPAMELDSLLAQQLNSLKAMFSERRADRARDNFDYLVVRALHLVEPPRLPSEFGMTQIAPPEQFLKAILRRIQEPEASSAALG